MSEERDIEVAATLGRIEQLLSSLVEDHKVMRRAVDANTRFRWRATAVGSFIIAVLGWFGFIR